jgi:hypothetical protein
MMNEAAFSLNRKLPNGDMITVRAEDVDKWKERITQMQAALPEIETAGTEMVQEYVGYTVERHKGEDLRVHFYKESKEGWKSLTAYENHFKTLPFRPAECPFIYDAAGPMDMHTAIKTQKFVFFDCKIRVRVNERFDKDNKESGPRYYYERMVEPAPLSPYEEAVSRLNRINKDNVSEAKKWIMQNQGITQEQKTELCEKIDAQLGQTTNSTDSPSGSTTTEIF